MNVFDWDDGNRYKNLLKHNVSRAEIEEVFLDGDAVLLRDVKHSSLMENRYIVLGRTLFDRHLFIIFTIRNNAVRVISARDMAKKERSIYEKTIKNSKI